MAHPLIFTKKTFFYPIGNTPPVCLTQDIPPEQPADILLLGCGDARNVLFTVHCSGLDVNTLPQKLDFTCCDMEPAVLARNALLFTMVVDKKIPSERMWNIYYDFFVKKETLSALCTHARTLVDASVDLETWQKKYGYFLQVVNRQTLRDMRRYWISYADFDNLPSQHASKLKSAAKTKMQDVLKTYNGAILSIARSAGPLLIRAIELTANHHPHLWRTGVHSLRPGDVTDATELNPTFVYTQSSGEEFIVHYGTDAISTFHLAPLFAANKAAPKPQAMIDMAQAQFKEWCSSFRRVVTDSLPKVVVRFFAGDALSLSRALHHCSCTSETLAPTYMIPWQTSVLELDGEEYGPNANPRAPVTFDVIDSSNLADHVGLLNILVVTQPLLLRKPSSVLYTETLLPMGADSITGFTDQVCGDLTVLSVLLDLVPSSFVSKFTSISNSHEIILQRSSKAGSQYHERTAWKVLSLSDAGAFRELCGSHIPVAFEAKQLGTFLFGLYLNMFAHESVTWQREQAQKGTLTRFLLHYTRGSFVSLLRLVRSRQLVDWEHTLDVLFKFLNTDRTLMLGLNSYQDLCVQLHILNLHSVDPLKPGWTKAPQGGRFQGWQTIPEMVCIVLVVPRGRFKIVEDIKADRLRTPTLICTIKGPSYHNDFSTITANFGSVTTVGSDEESEVVFHPDLEGRRGKSSLVVSFWAPSWILAISPSDTTIQLGLHSASGVHLLAELGLGLAIYSTNLLDKEHVYLSRSRPNYQNELDSLKAISYNTHVAAGAREVTVTLDAAAAQISTFMIRVDISGAAHRQELLDGAGVESEQETPHGVVVTFGSFHEVVHFPFPVDGTRTRLRVARKSHYIEVITSAAGPRTPGGHYMDPAPVMLQGTVATTWNIHRVYLDRLPLLDVTKRDALDWVNIHVSLMFADRERGMRSGGSLVNQSAHQTMVDVKDSLHHMFGMFTGQAGGGRHRVFSLSDPGEGGVYTLLFLKEFRLDLGAHTVLLDGYVLPLDISDFEVIPRMLETSDIAHALAIKTSGKEVEAWKRLLPALVERCRRTWEHGADCEYVVEGRVPRTTELEGNPICQCGRGKDVDGFKSVKAWAPFATMVTRIAIGPLFAVSYLETIAGSLGEGVTGSRGTRGRPSGASPPAVPLGTTDRCGRCGGGGKPTLLVCSKCKRARYCSSECQRVDWKEGHKNACK
ncbi:hypothetical protein OF83DRAFT_1096596 [Amylostereum chailletii]|nr:hypothetical protein OF83DRAFT_1096596 [Amylostereum chailletii]